jgi:hypothetical protein
MCTQANANIFLANHGGNARNGRGRWFFITRLLAMDVILCSKHLSETGSPGRSPEHYPISLRRCCMANLDGDDSR